MPADAEFIVLDAKINLKQWNKAVAQMEADAKNMEKILGMSSKGIELKFNESGLRSIKGTLDDLGAGVTSDVKFNAVGDDIERMASIDDVTIDVKADEDASVDSTINDIAGKLENLQQIAKIQLALDAARFIKDIDSVPLIGALIEIEELSHRVVGQTGRDLENVGRTINNVWTGNWGDSKDEIAEVVKTIAQVRDENDDFLVEAGNIEDVTVGAFQAAAVGGEEVLEVLEAASLMVKNDFAASYTEAFDIISLGFSEGLNANDDMLDTFTEYSSTFSALGITANGFFNILKSGTAAGAWNTDIMADSFKEMLNLTKEEVAAFQTFGDETDRTRALAEAGLMDEAEAYTAGEITGDEFSQGVIDTLVTQFEDPATQQRLAKAIFQPTMVENAGLGNLLQTDFQKTNLWEGQAKALSDEIFSGPGSAFQTMQRTLETHFLNALMNSVEAQAFMDKITIAAQRFGTELAEGATIGEALEIALEIPGLGDTLRQMESAFGNIAIVLLEVAATIGETFGMEVGGLREEIARFGAGQFVFDIQSAKSADELESRIISAINRGVSESEIADLTGQAVGERLALGDIEGARALVTALGEIPDMSQIEGGLSDLAKSWLSTHDVETAAKELEQQSQNILRSQEERAQLLAESQMLMNLPTFDTSDMSEQIDIFMQDMMAQMQAAVNEGDLNLAQTIGEQLGIQNIDKFITDQQMQPLIDSLSLTDEQIGASVTSLFVKFTNAMMDEDYEAGAEFAKRLINLDPDNPHVQNLIDDFAVQLMVKFNNAVGGGNVGEAQSILDLMGMSPENNQVALDSMTQRFNTFASTASSDLETVGSSAALLGEQIESTKDRGEKGISALYSAISSEKGQASVNHLTVMAKRFEAVADGIRDALEAINEGAKEMGGISDGKRVGGVGHAGFTTVGEGGREMVFADEKFAVLNNQTTERLFTALSGAAGTTNNTSNNRTVNYSPTIVVQNEAQAAMFGGQSLDQLRGNAF